MRQLTHISFMALLRLYPGTATNIKIGYHKQCLKRAKEVLLQVLYLFMSGLIEQKNINIETLSLKSKPNLTLTLIISPTITLGITIAIIPKPNDHKLL